VREGPPVTVIRRERRGGKGSAVDADTFAEYGPVRFGIRQPLLRVRVTR
jgi:hypothetical protein